MVSRLHVFYLRLHKISVELASTEDLIQKSNERPKKYARDIPDKIKKEVGIHVRDFGTASAIKKFTMKYPKYSFVRTVNSWKKSTKMVRTQLSKKLEDPIH